ncbi:MAG: hypothetical protein LUH10_00950 [Tannerellaceae bacterium]|nr:hypothetical protein [Tannerellaceae bacterium]
MKKLFILLIASWIVVFFYFLYILNSPIRSWLWLIIGFAGLFYLSLICIASGAIGVIRYKTLIYPAVVNGVCGFMCGMFAGEKGVLLLGGGGFLLTLFSALTAYVFTAKTTSATGLEPDKQPAAEYGEVPSVSLPPIPKPLKYFLMAVIIVLLNVLGAWCSWHDFIIDRGVYWKDITAHASHLTPKHFSEREGHPKNLLFDESGHLFTGVVEAYKTQLRVNPFPPVPKGVEYYVNGKCWGISNEDHTVVHPLRMYMSDIVPQETKPAYFVYQTYIQEIRSKIEEECGSCYFIHQDYLKNVRNILGEYKGGYVITPGQNSSIYLLGATSDNFWRLKVSYHDSNGIINVIDNFEQMSFDSEEGWDYNTYYSFGFDKLGKLNDAGKWRIEEFIFTDVFPDPVMDGVATPAQKEFLRKKLISTARICYWDKTFRWDGNQGVLENLYKYYDKESESIPNSIIYTGITNTGGKRIEGPDRELLLDILSRCNYFTIDDDCTVFLRDPEFSYLVVSLEGGREELPIYYVDGRFLLRYSFYSFPVDDPADRKHIEQMIQKYKS